MSYDVSLYCKCCGNVLRVSSHTEGGTYNAFGSELADLNVTYNYSPHYRRALDPDQGLGWLHEKSAGFTITRLQNAINMLKDDRSDDYWEATEGNARYALTVLLAWAKQHPEGVWGVH